ncbi:putative quinol monooxygenase [Phyllobacterium zundukense]|uniref:Antibiotic biosynthesis monooxygenase n=1 Tax=Phyllobacterium zundukense TaxID=1867719 RepID=A0ACD4CXZ8_9HYPH|nr:putative quinol monooxygenase [Phyllobacterium zundukense]UXN58491.1 antibiotic biosynthesis monooxygenase [Phyllobacterium zundukense]
MPRTFLSHIRPAALIAAAFAAPSAIAHDAGGLRYADMPADAYAVVAQVRARPGKEDALRAITLSLVPQVRAEPNNLLYFLQENREAPGHFIFYEIFASQADFEAHNQTPHVQSWFARLPELANGGVTVIRMSILNNAATDR